jgi:hypothetical protein
MIASLAQLKTRLGITDTRDDTDLAQALAGVSGILARECGRSWRAEPCLEDSEHTHLFSPERDQSSLWLPAWPVIEVTSLLEAWDGAFADADELVEGDDFRIDPGLGRLLRIATTWLSGPAAVQVVYRAGYLGPDTAVVADYDVWVTGTTYVAADRATEGGAYYVCITGHTASAAFATDAAKWREEFPMPADLVEAAIQQAAFIWQRRTALGLSGGSAGQGGSFSAGAEDDLLPGVRATCARYRRAMG